MIPQASMRGVRTDIDMSDCLGMRIDVGRIGRPGRVRGVAPNQVMHDCGRPIKEEAGVPL